MSQRKAKKVMDELGKVMDRLLRPALDEIKNEYESIFGDDAEFKGKFDDAYLGYNFMNLGKFIHKRLSKAEAELIENSKNINNNNGGGKIKPRNNNNNNAGGKIKPRNNNNNNGGGKIKPRNNNNNNGGGKLKPRNNNNNPGAKIKSRNNNNNNGGGKSKRKIQSIIVPKKKPNYIAKKRMKAIIKKPSNIDNERRNRKNDNNNRKNDNNNERRNRKNDNNNERRNRNAIEEDWDLLPQNRDANDTPNSISTSTSNVDSSQYPAPPYYPQYPAPPYYPQYPAPPYYPQYPPPPYNAQYPPYRAPPNMYRMPPPNMYQPEGLNERKRTRAFSRQTTRKKTRKM